MVVLRLARVHKVSAYDSSVQNKSPDETLSFCFAVVFCTHIALHRWGPFHGNVAELHENGSPGAMNQLAQE